MANWISRDEDLRKREEREKLDLTAQRLFGVIKRIHRKMNQPKPASVFSGYQTLKTFEKYQREFELQRSKALMNSSRLQTRLT